MKHYCVFSEAIREGAKIRPQCQFFLNNDIGSCALGAGVEAIHSEPLTRLPDTLVELYPYLTTTESSCPGCSESFAPVDRGSLLWLITHLNDFHQWTRESIADWLEREEEKLGFITVVEETNEQDRIPTGTLQTVSVEESRVLSLRLPSVRQG